MTTTPPPASPEPTPAYQPQPTAYAAAPAQKWNVLSIVTLVLGILGFAIVPVITGFISLNQIKKTGEQGNVLAIIGLILGFLGVLGWIIFWISFAAIWATATTNPY